MNTLILRADDMLTDTRAEVRGERAAHFREQQSPEPGQRIRVSVLHRFCASATVTESNEERLIVELESPLPAPPRLPVTLFVAVPRPQTVKKVISLAVQAGIERLYFVRSYLTVPSYLQSHTLRVADIERETVKALEQVWDCTPPEIKVVERMGEFFDTHLPALKKSPTPVGLFLGEPLGADTKSLADISRNSPFSRVVLGIGPEKGWSAAEQEGFAAAGFSLVHLDAREYRVETALAFFIGQLQLLLRS